MASPKLRPSMSPRQVELIADCLNFRIQELVKAGRSSSPVVLELIELKTYCESLQPKETSAQVLLKQYQALYGNLSEEWPVVNDVQVPIITGSIITESSVSPLDQPGLTQEQILDLLELRSSDERSDAENVWYLNVGTMVKLKRASAVAAKSDINEGDL